MTNHHHDPPTYTEFTVFETEHGFGAATLKGFVLVRIHLTTGVAVLTQLSPDEAREIASHLMESAARAEYEEDLWVGTGDMPEELKGMIMHAVRKGEIMRHES